MNWVNGFIAIQTKKKAKKPAEYTAPDAVLNKEW